MCLSLEASKIAIPLTALIPSRKAKNCPFTLWPECSQSSNGHKTAAIKFSKA
jgi:hypothetical protein